MKTMRRGVALALLVGLLTACGSPGAARAQNPDTDPAVTGSSASGSATAEFPAPDSVLAATLSRAFRTAARRALPAVVFVSVEKEVAARRMPVPEPFQRFFQMPEGDQPHFRQEGTGSGFIYDAEGYVMTNHHVVANATRVSVRLRDGREFSAEVVGSDPSTDVAILKIDPGGDELPVVELGSSEGVAVGDWVLALGNPLGLDFTVTAGIVSAKGRQLTAREAALEAFIQTDAAINMGNSGGPLIDLMGRVVGVNTAISGGQRWVGYGFAVPVSLAQRVAGDLIEYGRVRRPRLGVRVSDVTAVDAEAYRMDEVRGAEINTVEDGGPAEEAGLQIGDVVVAVNGETIEDATDLTTTLAGFRPGDEVTLTVLRDGERREIEAELGEFDTGSGGTATEAAAQEDTPETRLGFGVQELTPAIARELGFQRSEGVIVSRVAPNSNAAEAGVRRGQLLLRINDAPVSTVSDVQGALEGIEAGQVVSIRVRDPEIGRTIVNFRARE